MSCRRRWRRCWKSSISFTAWIAGNAASRRLPAIRRLTRRIRRPIVAADVDSLRTLLKNGISEATFGGIENFSVRLNYFYFVSNDLLNKIATEIWNGAALTAEKLLSDAGELIKDRAAGAYGEIFGALFPRTGAYRRKSLCAVFRANRQITFFPRPFNRRGIWIGGWAPTEISPFSAALEG